MENQINISEWIKNFEAGYYDHSSVDVQCDAGWFDWFCKDSSLANKTKALGKKLCLISNSKRFDNEKTYVFFKNNCPMVGNLYDDFRICDIDTGNVLFTVTPKSGHRSDNGNGSVWGSENEFEEPLIKGSWSEIKKWFNNEN